MFHRDGRYSFRKKIIHAVEMGIDLTPFRARLRMDPALMGDLLDYFEARSQILDQESVMYDSLAVGRGFISCICFNGVPILPPVLTAHRREEMHRYKRLAMRKENKSKAKRREELHARVQTIVAGVEERRAAKASQKSSPHKEQATLDVRSHLSSASSSRSSSVEQRKHVKGSASHSPSAASSSGTSKTKKLAESSNKPKSSQSNLKKNKSHSLQNLSLTSDKGHSFDHIKSQQKELHVKVTQNPTVTSNVPYTKHSKIVEDYAIASVQNSQSSSLSTSNSSVSTVKSTGKSSARNTSENYGLPQKSNCSSPSIIPHPPQDERKFSSRRNSPLRQSLSFPDLRTIDYGREVEEFKKIKSKDVSSMKGGRPQSGQVSSLQQNKTEKTYFKDKSTKEKGIYHAKSKTQDLQKGKESVSEKRVKGTSHRHDPEKEAVHKAGQSSKQNAGQVESEKLSMEQLQSAAAELFPFPITEEQALATLDSLQGDLSSLEECGSLPHDYNGIPLTNLKQQQIMQMLLRLSRALNIEDTLTSTNSSSGSGEQGNNETGSTVVDASTQLEKSTGRKNLNDGVNEHYNSENAEQFLNQPSQERFHKESMVRQKVSPNVTSDSTMTSPSQGSSTSEMPASVPSSSSSVHSRSRMSPTASILSSGSSITGSKSHMSPKLSKNTVHFASFVTEISTSASQSMEDRISVRKLDITPVHSQNFEPSEDETISMISESQGQAIPFHTTNVTGSSINDSKISMNNPKNLPSSGPCIAAGPSHSYQQGSLLSKVMLSPETDTSSGVQNQSQMFSFLVEGEETEINTSDKENEYVAESDGDDSAEENASPVVVDSHRSQNRQNTQSYPPKSYVSLVNYVTEVESDYVKPLQGADIVSDINTLKEKDDKLLTIEAFKRLNSAGCGSAQFSNGTGGTNITRYLKDSGFVSMQDVTSKSQQLQQEGVLDISPIVKHMEHESGSNTNEHRGAELVRRGSYTLDEPSAALLKSLAENNFLSTGPVTKNTDNIDSGNGQIYSDSDEDVIAKLPTKCDSAENVIHTNLKVCEVVSDSDSERQAGAHENKEEKEQEKEENKVKDDKESEVKNEDRTEVNVREENGLQENYKESDDDDDDEFQEGELMRGAIPSIQLEEEQEGKAEHIQRYLSHVHEHSLQNEEDFDCEESNDPPTMFHGLNTSGNPYMSMLDDISATIESFTTSTESMAHLSQEEILQIRMTQYDIFRTRLIEQQKQQLEELFVQQRKEQMQLQKDIEEYQIRLRNSVNSPASSILMVEQKVHQPQQSESAFSRQTGLVPQYAQQKRANLQTQQKLTSSNLQAQHSSASDLRTQHNSVSDLLTQQASGSNLQVQQKLTSKNQTATALSAQNKETSINQQEKSRPQASQPKARPQHTRTEKEKSKRKTGGVAEFPQPQISTSMPKRPSQPIQAWENHQPKGPVNITTTDHTLDVGSNHYSYIPSPGLYANPKDHADISDISSFAKGSPKQLVFSNQSTPNPCNKEFTMPAAMVRSQAKHPTAVVQYQHLIIPEEIYHSRIEAKFEKVTAAAKGFLTRCLLKSQKVQEIIKTVNDTRRFAFSFQAETPIRSGTFSHQDRHLLERIVAQLQAALLDIHEIFFVIPTSERMAIIAHSRMLQQNRQLRESESVSENVSRSQPRLSAATLKALERKRKAQEAEEAVFGVFRPQSAPPRTSSPHANACSTDFRALRPLQGQISPIRSHSQASTRENKERPKTAPERGAAKVPRKTALVKFSKPAASKQKSTSKTAKPKAAATITTTIKPSKAWR
ncbi:hypothetical protein CHS0354_039523 [Potamilus streckersoni]|uniref:Centriolar coiled-coil protein of 110 kDa n=2 Tax=Potamilus streckersoni TaxID=2493646 RepID=A0AAE0TLS3_9BIVA|nr:hypothetical protein CHS0354_039523 [Potamilus streckersoni]